jgi:hypothetical protein
MGFFIQMNCDTIPRPSLALAQLSWAPATLEHKHEIS